MKTNAFEILENIFTTQINVLSISVKVEALELEKAKEKCMVNNYDVQLIKDPDHENLKVYERKSDQVRSLNDSEVIADSTPLIEVFDALCEKEHLFVKVRRNVTHIVTRSDLDTIPVRIWLYGMMSLFEIELKQQINEMGLKWIQMLSGDRLKKAKDLYSQKKKRNEEISLIGYLQLGDIGTIITKSRNQFEAFSSPHFTRDSLEKYFKQLNELRDTLAHGQKIQMDWPEIFRLLRTITFVLRKTSYS